MPRARKEAGAAPKRARKAKAPETTALSGEIIRGEGGLFAPGNPWAWKRGESGNPGGRPKTTAQMRERAASLTDLAQDVQELAMTIGKAKMERAIDILRDPNASVAMLEWAGSVIEPGALAAAHHIMERGHGKAVAPPPGRANLFDGMTGEDIQNYIIKGATEMVKGMKKGKK